MNVYIRTNCNSKIGLGHLIRTSRLAIEMRKIGKEIIQKKYKVDLFCKKKQFPEH